MANDLNRTILLGRLTRDPEYKNVNGNSLVNLSVANNRSYSVNGEKKEETHYFECACWGKLADIVRQYCTKGSQVLISGALRQERWEHDGKTHTRVKIKVDTLQMVGSKKTDSPQTSNSGTDITPSSYPATSGGSGESTFEEWSGDDDMPF